MSIDPHVEFDEQEAYGIVCLIPGTDTVSLWVYTGQVHTVQGRELTRFYPSLDQSSVCKHYTDRATCQWRYDAPIAEDYDEPSGDPWLLLASAAIPAGGDAAPIGDTVC